MNVAFTICSNNYLARAKVVAETFISFHSDFQFFIFLVDKLDNTLNYKEFENFRLIEIDKIVDNVEELALQYNIIELNTAVKPAVFLYLFKKLNYNISIYLDPDLMIFSRFNEVEDLLRTENFNIVVTPHFCSPIDDGKYPSEIDLTVYGLYNLGFIAIKNSLESQKFLLWWHDRLMKYCYMKPDKGMFTDQLWVNYAPIFFDGVYVLKHLGYNVANWNLYERIISEVGDTFFINNKYKLKFFHFSHFQFDNPYQLSKHQNRHIIEDRPDIKMLIDLYQSELIKNNFLAFIKIPCYYHQLYQNYQDQLKIEADLNYYTFKRKLINKVTGLLESMIPG